MRTILALFIGAAMFAAPAFSECCCEYNGPAVQSGQRVSVGNTNGYYMQNGKVMLFRNGTVTELTQEATLDDGSRIMMDGTVVLRDGSRRNLANNQWIFLDGRFSEGLGSPNQAAINTDGYIRENGKTFVLRNGNRTEVTADMTFDNGTLQADGTIIMRDGTRRQLREGERMAFNGSIQQQQQNQRPNEQPSQNVSRDRFNENNNPNNAQPNAQPGQPNAQPAQPDTQHRDRGAAQSGQPSNPSNNAGQVNENHRDRGAAQSSPGSQTNQPTQGRSDQNNQNQNSQSPQPTQGRTDQNNQNSQTPPDNK